MKKLYWRPQRISLKVLWMLAFVAAVSLGIIEGFKVKEQQPFYTEKLKAARLTKTALEVIKKERLQRGIPIDLDTDPAMSGLIGVLLTDITTNPGHLPAKQTAVNPNFAAVIVHMLKRAGIEANDPVAVGFSGSFPSLNIAVMAALQTLGAKPIIISSVGASQWGANIANFTWLDMETTLFKQRVFSFRSVAASRGGVDDRALGLSKEGKQKLDEAISRNEIPMLNPKNFDDSLEKRFALYREYAGGNEIKVYINVGGGTTSVGTTVGKKMFKPGLNRIPPRGIAEVDSIMTRFIVEGVPVIHLTNIDTIAQRYGLPLQPTTPVAVGEGKVFVREVYNRKLVFTALFIILLLIYAFIRFDWGYRILKAGQRDKPSTRPEKMV
ncbi:MAG: poly-gamma-glutamate system protein [Myxococcota bacterium]